MDRWHALLIVALLLHSTVLFASHPIAALSLLGSFICPLILCLMGIVILVRSVITVGLSHILYLLRGRCFPDVLGGLMPIRIDHIIEGQQLLVALGLLEVVLFEVESFLLADSFFELAQLLVLYLFATRNPLFALMGESFL